MKTKFKFIVLLALCITIITSCKKGAEPAKVNPPTSSSIPSDDLDKIQKLGFRTNNVIKYQNGYIVENDIFLSKDALNNTAATKTVVIAKTEQYRTVNLVASLPRTLTISVSGLSQNFITATDAAIARWNGLGLLIQFQRVSSGANISIVGVSLPAGVLGSSGFPENGNPYPTVQISNTAFGSGSNIGYITSVIQHELGHCVGLRHTDYADRSYSCGGPTANEGNTYNPSNIQQAPGAVYIPGTLGSGEPGSVMLACNNGIDRTFSPNDIVALGYLYTSSGVPGPQPIYLFYSSGSGDHFITPDRNITALFSGWQYYGTDFKGYLTQVSGTVPVYEFYHSASGDHFDSIDPNATNGFGGWVNHGIAFYAYSTQVPGTIPVYLFYSGSGSDHFSSPNPNATTGFPGWSYYGIGFYALPN